MALFSNWKAIFALVLLVQAGERRGLRRVRFGYPDFRITTSLRATVVYNEALAGQINGALPFVQFRLCFYPQYTHRKEVIYVKEFQIMHILIPLRDTPLWHPL